MLNFSFLGSSLHYALLSLEEAKAKLIEIVNVKFDQAVEAGYLPDAMRFFKIFPLLKLDQVGLEKFCKHFCSEIKEYGEKNLQTTLQMPFNHKLYPVRYSNYLKTFLNFVATKIVSCQPIVESYYGKNLLHCFM